MDHHRYTEGWYWYRRDRATAKPWTVEYSHRNTAGRLGRLVRLKKRFPDETAACVFAATLPPTAFPAVARDELAPRPRPHQISWFERGPGGKRIRRHEHFPTRALAQAFLRELNQRLNSPLYPVAKEKTWHAALAEWETSMSSRSKQQRYYAHRALGSFTLHARPAYLVQVTPAMVEDYLATLAAGGVLLPERRSKSGRLLAGKRPRSGAATAVAQDYGALHHFFSMFVRRGDLSKHPMASLKKPSPDKALTIPPTPQQWVRLLEVLPDLDVDAQAWHLLILIAVTTGIDQADLLKITLEPVTPPRWHPFRFSLGSDETDQLALLAARRTKTRGFNLFGLPRVVSDRLALRVAALEPGTKFLFPWRTFRRKQWDSIRAAAQFAFPFKALRSAAATQIAEATALDAAAAQLGHHSSSLTRKHYVSAQRMALALATRVHLPELPPFPEHVAAPAPRSSG